MGHSSAETQGVRVDVDSIYVPERSDPQRHLFYFAYRIKISNNGPSSAKLIARHWVITNGWGEIEHVKGPGVVGQQPRLEPGESFEYSSACPLATPLGSMHGSYQMQRDDGRRFDAEIAVFSLEMPQSLN